MKAAEAQFSYPVLGFTKDTEVWGFKDLHELTICAGRALKKNVQDGMELIGADGARWVVTSTRRLNRTNSWINVLMTAGVLYRVDYELESLSPLTLGEVQARVCHVMEAHPEDWCDDSDLLDFPERLADVRAATSIAGIYQLLGLDILTG